MIIALCKKTPKAMLVLLIFIRSRYISIVQDRKKFDIQIMPKFTRQICLNWLNDLKNSWIPCEILIRFDRLYFAVVQAEPEKWAQKHSRLSRPLSDIWTSRTCIRVGHEVSMSDRSDSFRSSVKSVSRTLPHDSFWRLEILVSGSVIISW